MKIRHWIRPLGTWSRQFDLIFEVGSWSCWIPDSLAIPNMVHNRSTRVLLLKKNYIFQDNQLNYSEKIK